MTSASRDRDESSNRDARHVAAIARTLEWADEAAERGDFERALGWLRTAEIVDGRLPALYDERRIAWLEAFRNGREAR